MLSLSRAGRQAGGEGARDASGWMISARNQEVTRKRGSSLAGADSQGRVRAETHVHHQESDLTSLMKAKRMRSFLLPVINITFITYKHKHTHTHTHTHTQGERLCLTEVDYGKRSDSLDERGSMRKDDAVWVRAEQQAGISDAVVRCWSHDTCGHVFWLWLFFSHHEFY